MEKALKSPLLRCKTASSACSKLEDEAIAFLVECHTSPKSVKSNIVELMQIENAAQKLVSALEFLTNSSVSAEFEAVECTALIGSIVEIQTLFSQTSLLGSGPTIVSKTKMILSQVIKMTQIFFLIKILFSTKLFAMKFGPKVIATTNNRTTYHFDICTLHISSCSGNPWSSSFSVALEFGYKE